MKSMKVKVFVLLLLVGVLSACASPATDTPAPQPTDPPVLATEAPATALAAATDTAAPAGGDTPTAGAASGGATVSFSTDILPLLESRCVNCHGGDRTQEGLDLKTHASIMAGSENGPVVTPGDAANSNMAELVSTGKMPKRGPKLTPDQVQLIVEWINQGALDN
jgi:mono/diheme cytochrome c family protein